MSAKVKIPRGVLEAGAESQRRMAHGSDKSPEYLQHSLKHIEETLELMAGLEFDLTGDDVKVQTGKLPFSVKEKTK